MGPFGNDTVDYSHATAGVTADLATPANNIGAAAAGDTYISIENLRGTTFDDHLFGDGSNNVLEGGLGNDTLDGRGGNNTASYEHATAGVTVDLTVTAQQNTIGAGTDTLTNIQNLTGSQSSDRLTGDSHDNIFFGLGGNDTFVFKSNLGHDTIADFTPGQDRIELDFDPLSGGEGNPGTFEMWLGSHAQASGNDTLITLDVLHNNTILLKNVNVANVHATDFIVNPH
jgi:Ca2+-binding RTX toxin-like protein